MGHTLKVTTLNDIIDTLKLQFYPNGNTTLEEIENFNSWIDKFVELKQEAMAIKNHDNQKRFIKTTFSNTTFKVMATSQSSFNVVLQNGDISISLLRISKTHKNPVVKVEFRAEFLLRNGYKNAIELVKDIINNLFENYFIKVSEIHLAKDVQGFEFNPLDIHRLKTVAKNKTVYHNDISSEHYFGNKFSGFSIGSGDEMLRIYNKTLEISQKKEKSFIQVLSWNYNSDFDNSKNVWRIEFQLRRAKLKEYYSQYGQLDSLENVINSISNLWTHCIKTFVLKNLSQQQLIEQIYKYKYNEDGTIDYIDPETLRKRFQRSSVHPIWEQLNTFENKQNPKVQKIKDIKKPEVEYVKNAYKAVLSTFVKLKRGEFDSHELTSILIQAEDEAKDTHGITLVDKARLNALDYINHAQFFYEQTGVIDDGFYNYKKDLYNNIQQTFTFSDTEPSNLFTFYEFQKRMFNILE
ncbi:MAG: hypothetical protein ACQERD_00940 [Campylobacterota bacterium]